MLCTTVKDVLSGNVKLEDASLHRIYLVRENNLVFYVGQSFSPLARLLEHIGLSRGYGRTDLGECVWRNAPSSGLWVYEALTVTDCLPIIERHQTMDLDQCSDWNNAAVDAAERALILHYRPCLNVEGNPHPTPLPDKYNWYLVVNPLADKIAQSFGFE